MLIFINTMCGDILDLEVESSDTISCIKAKIRATQGFPPALQRLIYADEQLQNDRTLADYNIHKESSLDLVVRSRNEIYVKTSTWKTTTLKLKDLVTVHDIKRKMCAKKGIPCEQQCLIFKKEQLKDGRKLRYYNIGRESTIVLVRLPDSAKKRVKDLEAEFQKKCDELGAQLSITDKLQADLAQQAQDKDVEISRLKEELAQKDQRVIERQGPLLEAFFAKMVGTDTFRKYIGEISKPLFQGTRNHVLEFVHEKHPDLDILTAEYKYRKMSDTAARREYMRRACQLPEFPLLDHLKRQKQVLTAEMVLGCSVDSDKLFPTTPTYVATASASQAPGGSELGGSTPGGDEVGDGA